MRNNTNRELIIRGLSTWFFTGNVDTTLYCLENSTLYYEIWRNNVVSYTIRLQNYIRPVIILLYEILFLDVKTYYSIPSKTVIIIPSGLGMDFPIYFEYILLFSGTLCFHTETQVAQLCPLCAFMKLSHTALLWHTEHYILCTSRVQSKKNVTDKVIHYKDANPFFCFQNLVVHQNTHDL